MSDPFIDGLYNPASFQVDMNVTDPADDPALQVDPVLDVTVHQTEETETEDTAFVSTVDLSQPDEPGTLESIHLRVLIANWDEVEQAAGIGGQDGITSTKDLEAVADPNSGFDPQVQRAAQYFLDNPEAFERLEIADDIDADPDQKATLEDAQARFHSTVPGVQSTITEIVEAPQEHQAALIGAALAEHEGDAAWRESFVTAMNAQERDLFSDVLSNYEQDWGIIGSFSDDHHSRILFELSDHLTPAQFRDVLANADPSAVAALIEKTLFMDEHPMEANEADYGARMEAFAGALGDIADQWGIDNPAVQGLIDEFMTNPSELIEGTSRAEVAAWLVARSGSEELKADFVERYLPQYDPAADNAPEMARALAIVMGSEAQPSIALDELIQLDPATRRAFINDVLTTDPDQSLFIHENIPSPFGVRGDIHEDLGNFFTHAARINTDLYPGHEDAAAEFQIETFVELSNALGDEPWAESAPLQRAAANLFNLDAENIIATLADGSETNRFAEDSDALISFFEHVLFNTNDPKASEIALGAVQEYTGIGVDHYGIADELADNQGDTQFMENGGNLKAYRLGFVMGALWEGGTQGVDNLQSDYDQKLVLVKVLGAFVEPMIEDVPHVGTAYKRINAGTDDAASVDTVATWLFDNLGPGNGIKLDQANIRKLMDGVVDSVESRFFSTDALLGANPQEHNAMLQFYNQGVDQAVRLPEEGPGIQLGG